MVVTQLLQAASRSRRGPLDPQHSQRPAGKVWGPSLVALQLGATADVAEDRRPRGLASPGPLTAKVRQGQCLPLSLSLPRNQALQSPEGNSVGGVAATP